MSEDERSVNPTSGSDSESGKKKLKGPKPRRKVVYKLAAGEKGWIKPNFTQFVLKIGRRGAKGDTARAYCTNSLTPRFMDKFYKDADSVNEETKKTKYEADYAIYVYLSNLWKKERKRIRKLDGPDDGSGPSSGLTKFHPQYYWADANGEEISATLEKKIKDQPSLANDVGLWRHTVSELFKAKPPEEQGKWKNQAKREKVKHKVAAKAKEPLSDKEKMMFVKDWCMQMENLVKLGESRGGIQTLIHFGMPDVKEVNSEEKKIMTFTSYTSKQSGGYTRTKDFNDGEEKFGHYVAKNMGARAERGIPIAVTPADDGAPVIPELPDNPVLSLLRALVRSSLKAHWLYAAGQGKVPWTEISQAIAAGEYDWIKKNRLPTERLPSGKRVRFIDPGEMTIDECLIWLRHLKRRQHAESDTSMNFQFQQVYAIRTHVFPEWTKSYHKQPTQRAHVDVYLVQYRGYLDWPETYDPIPYEDNSWDYFYRDTGKAGLIHWVGLPSRPKAPVPPQVSSSEIEVYRDCLDLVNRLDRGIPLIAQDKLWHLANQKPREVPLAIPQTPPSPSALQQWLALPWVVSYLLAPHEVERTGSSTLFEDWQHRMRSGPLYHPLSKTYRGGRLRVVWVIRGILKHLATVGAAAGVLKLPKDAPTGSDFSRLTLADWDRATTWLAVWHSLLEEACQSLESTVRERQKPALTASSGSDNQQSIKDGGVSDSRFDLTMGSIEDPDTAALPPRNSIPRLAKISASYVDPYVELDDDRPEPEGSESPSESDGEASDEDDVERSLESRLPKLLRAAPMKSGNYDERSHVFGPKPKAKPVIPHAHDPEKIREGVDAYFQTTSDLFSTYKSLKLDNGLPYTTKLRDWIHQHTSSIEEPRRHLVSTVLLQRLTWRQAQVVWPNAEAQYHEFQQASREGFALLDAIKGAKNDGKGGSDMDDIITREDELIARVWTTCLIYEQFSVLALLSVKYANKLRDRFLTIPLNAEYSELKRVVAVIRDWRQEYSMVAEGLRNHRKSVDEEHQLDDYVPHVQNSWFWHGNPSGFVLDAKAEELVKEIPISTELEYEGHDDEEQSASEPKRNDRHRRKVGNAAADSGAGRGGDDDCNQGGTMEGASSTKKPTITKPKPKPKPPPVASPVLAPTTTTYQPATVSSACPLAQPTLQSPPHSPPASPDATRSSGGAATESRPLVPSPRNALPTRSPIGSKPPVTTGGSSSKSKGKAILTPTIELPKLKGKANRKASSSATVGMLNQDKAQDSAISDVAAPPPSASNELGSPADEPSKKRQASSETVTGTKRRKASKVSSTGKEGESGAVDEAMSGNTGQPKRKRVPSARARGVA